MCFSVMLIQAHQIKKSTFSHPTQVEDIIEELRSNPMTSLEMLLVEENFILFYLNMWT